MIIDWDDLAPPCFYCKEKQTQWICSIKDHSGCPPRGKVALCEECSLKRGMCLTCDRRGLKVYREPL